MTQTFNAQGKCQTHLNFEADETAVSIKDGAGFLNHINVCNDTEDNLYLIFFDSDSDNYVGPPFEGSLYTLPFAAYVFPANTCTDIDFANPPEYDNGLVYLVSQAADTVTAPASPIVVNINYR